jgi:hypothetical protein
MALLASRLRKAEEQTGVDGSDARLYIEAYKKYLRGDDNGEAVQALPPYNPSKKGLTLTEVLIFAMHEVKKEARLEGKELVLRFGADGSTVKGITCA